MVLESTYFWTTQYMERTPRDHALSQVLVVDNGLISRVSSDVPSSVSVNIHKICYTCTQSVYIHRSRMRDSLTERKIETHRDGLRKT